MEITFGKKFCNGYINCLLFNEIDRLIENYYHPETVLIGTNFCLRGHQALEKYFSNHLDNFKYSQIEPTNTFTFKENIILLRSILLCNQEKLRINDHWVSKRYDILLLKEDLIFRHFINVTEESYQSFDSLID